MSDSKVKYYMPITIVSNRVISINGEAEAELDLKWADGMVGVLPLFDSLESAKSYAGVNSEVVVFEGPQLKDATNAE